MLKLSRKKVLFLAIGLLVVLGAGLSVLWLWHVREQDQLKGELALVQIQLNKSKNDVTQASAQQQALQARLVQVRSQVAAYTAGPFQTLESIEIDQTLFDIAKASGVKMGGITLSDSNSINLNGIRYSAHRANVQIEGSQSNLLDFVLKWTENYPTGVVVSVNLQGVAPAEGPAGEGAQPSASLELLIYTYAGR